MSCKKFWVLFVFAFCQFGIKNVISKLGKCGQQVQLRHPRGGSHTHDDPHKTEDVRTADRPLLVQKKTV